MNKKIIAIVAVIALVAILGVCLVACNSESYSKKLEKAGYTVIALTEEDLEDSDASIEWGLNATKANGLLNWDTVSIVKYKDSDDAKDAESDAVRLLGEDCVYRVGKIVMVGTAQGIKDAK